VDYHSDRAGGGDVQLPDTGRPAGAARPGNVLAGPPLAPGQHQQDQGDRPLVQQELYPPDEGREEHGDPGQPVPDQAAPGVSETLNFAPAPEPQTYQAPQGDDLTIILVQQRMS